MSAHIYTDFRHYMHIVMHVIVTHILKLTHIDGDTSIYYQWNKHETLNNRFDVQTPASRRHRRVIRGTGCVIGGGCTSA